MQKISNNFLQNVYRALSVRKQISEMTKSVSDRSSERLGYCHFAEFRYKSQGSSEGRKGSRGSVRKLWGRWGDPLRTIFLGYQIRDICLHPSLAPSPVRIPEVACPAKSASEAVKLLSRPTGNLFKIDNELISNLPPAKPDTPTPTESPICEYPSRY